MKEQGIRIFTTDYARNNFSESIKEKKTAKKVRCPQCEINLRNKKLKETK
jgi:hypothetical protein